MKGDKGVCGEYIPADPGLGDIEGVENPGFDTGEVITDYGTAAFPALAAAAAASSAFSSFLLFLASYRAAFSGFFRASSCDAAIAACTTADGIVFAAGFFGAPDVCTCFLGAPVAATTAPGTGPSNSKTFAFAARIFFIPTFQ